MKPVAAIGLAGAAFVAAAVAYTVTQPPAVATDAFGELVLPALQAADPDAIAVISVAQADQAVRVEKDADGVWRVAQLDGYPADPAVIRRGLTGLAGLTRLERRTTKPENHARLDLAAASAAEGAGRAVTVESASGETLASVLLGRDGGDVGGRGGAVFLRAPDDDQTWVASGRPDLSADPVDWIEARFLNIRQERVRRVDVLRPLEGAPYAVIRDAWDQDEPRIEPMPAGRELTTPGAARLMAFALESLRLDAVRERPSDVEGEQIARIALFDGVTIAVETLSIDGVEWLAFAPSYAAPADALPEAAFDADRNDDAKPKRPEAADAEASALAARLAPWIFQPPSPRRDRFQRPSAEMTQAVDG